MMTGLTDAMRSDFRLMQAVANITRISPQARVDRTYQFLKRIKANPEVHIYLHSLFLPWTVNDVKGQIISKLFFSGRGFFQKTNKNTLHTSKNEFICSFFGRILGLTICFRN